jgi:transcriptional regulator with XRE-family HTH domain
MKVSERQEARRLRRDQGLSLKDIAHRLGVAKSSVSRWVRDIELTPEQRRRLEEQNGMYARQLLAHAVWSEQHRARRRTAQSDGRLAARRGDPFHAAACMLYWAEGGKGRNQVRLSTADPEVVRFFVRFLRRQFAVDDAEVRITCHLFADHVERREEIEEFWLRMLELPPTSLCKSVVNVYSKYSQKKRKNRLPYGTCRVVVSRTTIVQHIYGAIQEYAGFDRPEWLG